ncbi:MAG TPA: CHRD domain-containing protein [Dissulfurispiraceae bacterium]
MQRMHLIVFVLIASLVSVGIAAEKANTFKVKLTGSEIVPPVKTTARGEAVFNKGRTTNEVTYRLTVHNLQGATAAHIHEGKKGKNGPPIATLFAGPTKTAKFTGTLAEGTITGKDLIGPLKGKTLKEFVHLMNAGELYVNVHTEKYPDGELRGQIK